MRVFYCRPSDNGNYGVEQALAGALPPPEELHVAFFRGYRVPLEPLNYAPREAGLANLGRYDLVVLAGLDPVALSPAEQLAVVAYVERGGGLLMLGGSHSFGNAEGTYALLEPVLPVRVLRGLDVEANVMPAVSGHPIARGLPAPLGYVRKVHPVEPKPGAQVAMRAGELPLAVAGEHGYGRAVVVASFPECEESEYGWFFTGDAFDDFLRGAVAWLRKLWEPVWFESFSLPNRQVLVGNEEFGRVKLGALEDAETLLKVRLSDRSGRIIHEAVVRQTARVAEQPEAIFAFRVPDDPRLRGLLYVAVIAADASGRELARRDVAIEAVNPTRVSLAFEHGRRAFLPGQAAALRIRAASSLREPPAELALELSLAHEQGQPILAPRRRLLRRAGDAYEEAALSFPVPRARPGVYRLKLEARVGGELADLVEEELLILAPPRAGGGFPLIAEGGYHLDRPTTDWGIGELVAAGANAVSLPGPPAGGFAEMPHREAMLGCAEERAGLAGLLVVHQRRSLLPGLSPAAPLSPCALSAEFRSALEKEVRPLLAAAGRVPALGFAEVTPRAAVRPAQLCRCPACQGAYKRTLGADMPQGDPAALEPAQRRALAAFVTSYWWHVFSAVQKVRDETASGVRLCMGFDASSFLRDGPSTPYSDPLVWARAAEGAEVAAEPDLSRLRLSLAGHQAVLAALGKPWGAQVELAEGALPPSAAAFTALLYGAAWLRVAENPRFVFFEQQAPLGKALDALFHQVAKAGPLLAATSRMAPRLALIFPFTEAATEGSGELLAAFELLHAAAGEVGLLHERMTTDEALGALGAVAVLGSRVLPTRAAAAIARFVERGGLLLADNAELRDDEDRPLAWPEGFFGEAETPVFGEISVRRRRFGLGRTLLFTAGIVKAHREAVERGDSLAARELCRAIAAALAEHGVKPRARAADPEVDAGLRACADTWLLVAVNHSPEPRTTRVELDPEAVPAACAFDLATGEDVHLETRGGLAITIRLGAHAGGLWALYPERPFTLRLETAERAGNAELHYRALVLNEAGRPARGCHIVKVAVSDPSGAERPELGGERLTAGGVLESAEPLAVNDRPGRWSLRLTDPLTRRVVRRAVEVAPCPSAAEADKPRGFEDKGRATKDEDEKEEGRE